MNITKIIKATQSKLYLGFAVLALSACSEHVSTLDMAADGSSLLKMTPPAFLNTRAVVVDNLRLTVTINRESIDMVKSGEEWTGQATVLEGSDVALEVQWSELIGSRTLLLAIARSTVASIDNAHVFNVEESSFVIDGADFDADADSINNITERRQDTDPFDASSPGAEEVTPDVIIPGSTIFNAIDSEFNIDFWNNAQFENAADGTTLRISNLIVDEAGIVVSDPDPDVPNYQWAGIHDGEFLTLYVFGKSISLSEGVAASRDSGALLFNDDSVEIFWDPDLSQLTQFDELDDMQIVIPLVRGLGNTAEANKSGELDSEIEKGANVNAAVVFDVNNVEFANCLCQFPGERVTWEIRINMAEARIPIGKTFGFEIQINQDDDGGERDSKWAWAAEALLPGQSKEVTDVAWKFPSTWGLMKLIPIPD